MQPERETDRQSQGEGETDRIERKKIRIMINKVMRQKKKMRRSQ